MNIISIIAFLCFFINIAFANQVLDSSNITVEQLHDDLSTQLSSMSNDELDDLLSDVFTKDEIISLVEQGTQVEFFDKIKNFAGKVKDVAGKVNNKVQKVVEKVSDVSSKVSNKVQNIAGKVVDIIDVINRKNGDNDIDNGTTQEPQTKTFDIQQQQGQVPVPPSIEQTKKQEQLEAASRRAIGFAALVNRLKARLQQVALNAKAESAQLHSNLQNLQGKVSQLKLPIPPMQVTYDELKKRALQIIAEKRVKPEKGFKIPPFVKQPRNEINAPLDPFAAYHFKKGFVPGSLGPLQLTGIKTPKAFVQSRLIEDCMACRFVWKSVEVDVGNTERQKIVYDSFVNHCRRAMTTPIMYTPCQLMYTHLDDMVIGYASGLTVDEICAQSHLCR